MSYRGSSRVSDAARDPNHYIIASCNQHTEQMWKLGTRNGWRMKLHETDLLSCFYIPDECVLTLVCTASDNIFGVWGEATFKVCWVLEEEGLLVWADAGEGAFETTDLCSLKSINKHNQILPRSQQNELSIGWKLDASDLLRFILNSECLKWLVLVVFCVEQMDHLVDLDGVWGLGVVLVTKWTCVGILFDE